MSNDALNFEYKDLFGHDIKPGDYIIYAGLADRSAVLRAGQVIELTRSKPKYSFETAKPKIRAKSWNNFRSQWNGDHESSGRQRDVVLEFFDRLIVVSKDQLSEKIIKDLDGPVCDYTGKPI